MKKAHRTLGFFHLTVMAGLAMVVLLTALSVRQATAFCETAGGGGERSPDEECHPELVRNSLTFLRSEILDTIAGHINDPDDYGLLNHNYASDDHFDSCNFDGAIERINDRYLDSLAFANNPFDLGAVFLLSPLRLALPSPDPQRPMAPVKDRADLFHGAKKWAWLLHATQDFYAHSNWVELGFTDPAQADQLIDSGFGPWTDISPVWEVVREGIIASQSEEDLPDGWAIDFPSSRRVPRVTTHTGEVFQLLMTGETTNPFQACPDAASMDHDDLHKDNSTRSFYPEARDMAKAQTRHEWCRLLHLTQQTSGIAGAAVPMGLMVDPSAAPHPEHTACAAQPAGPIEVTVRIADLKVLNDRDSGDPGELNLVFTLFTDDFQRSVRTQTNVLAVDSGTRLHPLNLPPALSLCLTPAERLVATVQGWDDDDSPTARGDLDSDDDILSGVTYLAGSGAALQAGMGLGTFTQRSDNAHAEDLEATFEVSTGPTDADGDGLSLCQELARGTDPDAIDSNQDGLSDSGEVLIDLATRTAGGAFVPAHSSADTVQYILCRTVIGAPDAAPYAVCEARDKAGTTLSCLSAAPGYVDAVLGIHDSGSVIFTADTKGYCTSLQVGTFARLLPFNAP